MLALGLTLLVSVAAAPPPPAHADEKVASTYDEASCDAGDGGECAVEPPVELAQPAVPAILDCESPFIAEMIGSCDIPKPTLPSLHLPTLHNAGNDSTIIARDGSTRHLTTSSAGSSLDGALTLVFSLAPNPGATPLFGLAPARAEDAPRSRLDRPPRA